MIEDRNRYFQVRFFIIDFFDNVVKVCEWIVVNMNYFIWFKQSFWLWFIVNLLQVVYDCIDFFVVDWCWMVRCIVDKVYYMWYVVYQVLVCVVYDYLDQNVIWEEFVFVFVMLVVMDFNDFFSWYYNFVKQFFYIV